MPVTIFSWGYWGWGNATEQLLQGVDAVEAARGFAPPMFVDIRIQRTGRAKGFAGDHFEKVLGPDRYRWMKSLGNRSVAHRSGPRVQIDQPCAASVLLDLALEAKKRKQRILFFCACEFIRKDGEMSCHRDVVADLVLAEARRRGISMSVVEWPGGDPAEVDIEFTPQEWKAMSNRSTIPLDEPVPLAEFAGLPWCTVAHLSTSELQQSVLVGPARYARQWVLPILAAPESDGSEELEAEGRRIRQAHGFEPRHTTA